MHAYLSTVANRQNDVMKQTHDHCDRVLPLSHLTVFLRYELRVPSRLPEHACCLLVPGRWSICRRGPPPVAVLQTQALGVVWCASFASSKRRRRSRAFRWWRLLDANE